MCPPLAFVESHVPCCNKACKYSGLWRLCSRERVIICHFERNILRNIPSCLAGLETTWNAPKHWSRGIKRGVYFYLKCLYVFDTNKTFILLYVELQSHFVSDESTQIKVKVVKYKEFVLYRADTLMKTTLNFVQCNCTFFFSVRSPWNVKWFYKWNKIPTELNLKKKSNFNQVNLWSLKTITSIEYYGKLGKFHFSYGNIGGIISEPNEAKQNIGLHACSTSCKEIQITVILDAIFN